jgi:hypothetical protein
VQSTIFFTTFAFRTVNSVLGKGRSIQNSLTMGHRWLRTDIGFIATVACDSKRTLRIGPPSNSIHTRFKFIFAHEIIRPSSAAFSSGE